MVELGRQEASQSLGLRGWYVGLGDERNSYIHTFKMHSRQKLLVDWLWGMRAEPKTSSSFQE